MSKSMCVLLVACSCACARRGTIRFDGGALAEDTVTLSDGDLASLGDQPVRAIGFSIADDGASVPAVLYRPAQMNERPPAVIFLPGRMAPEDQYQSYARLLASRGFVVLVRGWYSPFHSDEALMREASIMLDWLVDRDLVDPARIGIAGHSMGAKDAIWAAAVDQRFGAVVALDPDDNGRVSVVHGPLADLDVPLLLIGAEHAWKASSVCAPKATNYERFFERSPPGTVELVLVGADHVQVMDDPERLGYGICRSGDADSLMVRILARRAMVRFFLRHLTDAEPPPPAVASKRAKRTVR